MPEALSGTQKAFSSHLSGLLEFMGASERKTENFTTDDFGATAFYPNRKISELTIDQSALSDLSEVENTINKEIEPFINGVKVFEPEDEFEVLQAVRRSLKSRGWSQPKIDKFERIVLNSIGRKLMKTPKPSEKKIGLQAKKINMVCRIRNMLNHVKNLLGEKQFTENSFLSRLKGKLAKDLIIVKNTKDYMDFSAYEGTLTTIFEEAKKEELRVTGHLQS